LYSVKSICDRQLQLHTCILYIFCRWYYSEKSNRQR